MTEQTTLLENDIARLSEAIAEQYAIDAHYLRTRASSAAFRNADGTGVAHRRQQGRQRPGATI